MQDVSINDVKSSKYLNMHAFHSIMDTVMNNTDGKCQLYYTFPNVSLTLTSLPLYCYHGHYCWKIQPVSTNDIVYGITMMIAYSFSLFPWIILLIIQTVCTKDV